MSKLLVAAVAALATSVSAFSPVAAPADAARRSASSPVMSEEGVMGRRAVLAALVLGAPAAANAMIVPGLNGPGLVPAKKGKASTKPEWESIRDSGTNHFWSPKGIMVRFNASPLFNTHRAPDRV